MMFITIPVPKVASLPFMTIITRKYFSNLVNLDCCLIYIDIFAHLNPVEASVANVVTLGSSESFPCLYMLP